MLRDVLPKGDSSCEGFDIGLASPTNPIEIPGPKFMMAKGFWVVINKRERQSSSGGGRESAPTLSHVRCCRLYKGPHIGVPSSYMQLKVLVMQVARRVTLIAVFIQNFICSGRLTAHNSFSLDIWERLATLYWRTVRRQPFPCLEVLHYYSIMSLGQVTLQAI